MNANARLHLFFVWRSLDPEAGCPNFFEGRAPPPFTYKRIPIFDNRGEDILQYMESAIAFIEQVGRKR